MLHLYAALVCQLIALVYAERLSATSDAPIPSSPPIPAAPHTNLKPMIPIIVASALGGFFGFLIVVFGGLYLIKRKRRSKDVNNVIEGAHFPTMRYNSHPIASPPASAGSQKYNPYAGYDYSRWDKSEDGKSPSTPPGLPACVVRS
ncbi:hypothetical protein RSOLAG1IB_08509 [Rhizoctonia solani AG-1 IB]|uniref:Uncharacterized protein n=1 Tax=Thanatephorus cucumeris (strain AG1-IB / isolate 7/3/14) TaxID=1108050 RepID=A0A0B7FQG7_THACB|nr:hypothetical protein RSOLAG1IB_08509 [Rhizoctonia solani AG-1 IB]